MKKSHICNLLINLSGLILLILTFVSYRLLADEYGNAETRPQWFACVFLAIWIAIASSKAKDSKKACAIVPILFFLWMVALSIVKLFIYREELGDYNCVQTIIEIIKWNSFCILCIPLLLIANIYNNK